MLAWPLASEVLVCALNDPLLAAAVHVTVTPLFAVPCVSATVTMSGAGRSVPSVACCASPLVFVMTLACGTTTTGGVSPGGFTTGIVGEEAAHAMTAAITIASRTKFEMRIGNIRV
jgi:hypothetical protein